MGHGRGGAGGPWSSAGLLGTQNMSSRFRQVVSGDVQRVTREELLLVRRGSSRPVDVSRQRPDSRVSETPEGAGRPPGVCVPL